MEISAALHGRLDEFMERKFRGVQTGIKTGVADTAKALQLGWRGAINQRFSGSGRVRGGNRRMANAIRMRVYENDNAGAGAIVYSKFGRKDASGKFVDYLLPHVTGATIRPKNGRWIYIPLQKGRRAKTTRFSEQNTKNLAFIPLSGGRALLVRKTRTRSTPIALLLRFIRIPKGLNFEAIVRREQAALGRRLLENMEAAA